jgi:hypothetical protein
MESSLLLIPVPTIAETLPTIAQKPQATANATMMHDR